MGSLSLTVAAGVLFLIWLTLAIPTQQLPQLGPSNSNLAAGVRNAASCESLKVVCSSLAAIHDDQSNYLSSHHRLVERVKNFVGLFVLGWGVLSAAGFFYIFYAARTARSANDVAV